MKYVVYSHEDSLKLEFSSSCLLFTHRNRYSIEFGHKKLDTPFKKKTPPVNKLLSPRYVFRANIQLLLVMFRLLLEIMQMFEVDRVGETACIFIKFISFQDESNAIGNASSNKK